MFVFLIIIHIFMISLKILIIIISNSSSSSSIVFFSFTVLYNHLPSHFPGPFHKISCFFYMELLVVCRNR